MQAGLRAADALHRGDCHAIHAAERGQAGVDRDVLHCPFLELGHHHSARPTASLRTPQLGPREVHCAGVKVGGQRRERAREDTRFSEASCTSH